MTDHLINRPAILTNCTRCGAVTITGITGGLTTITDTKPLTVTEEITALMSGKTTLNLTAAGHALFLTWRSVTEIRAGRHCPVVAVHDCPAGTRQEPVPTAVTAPSLPDNPPF